MFEKSFLAIFRGTPHVSGLSYDVVEIFLFLATLCSPSTPRGRQLLVWSASLQPKARALHVPALSSVRPVDVHVLSVQSVVCA